MNKKGLIGKIFAIIGILLLIVIILAGITAYQAYNLIKDFKEKTPVIQENIKQLTAGDCSKLLPIETDITELKTRVASSCKNPIINSAVERLDQIPIKCNQLPNLEQQITNNIKPIKEYCANSSK